MKKYNCIIVGAGPAGISTALNLVREGINDICIIDKSKFPRNKPCAGYLTNKTKKMLNELGIDIEKNNYKLIKGFKLIYKYKIRLKLDNQGLWSNHKIDREELDYALYNQAKNQKIEIHEGRRIIKHNEINNILKLDDGSEYQYKYLILADGCVGYSLKYQNPKKKKNIAMQLTFKNKHTEEVTIHFGITKKGYAWVSSTGKVTNIGITDVFNPKIDYQQIFSDFVDQLGYRNKVDLKNIHGTFVPIKINKDPIINDNIYLVGDAVGAADPITLAGVSYALTTGKYAALSIKHNSKEIYIKEIRKLSIKFNYMSKFMHIFYFKISQFCLFRVGTHFFGEFISYAFDHLFVDNKFNYRNVFHIFIDFYKMKYEKRQNNRTNNKKYMIK